MNYCLRGRDMLKDLQRSEWLPPHDDDGLRALAAELEDLNHRLEIVKEAMEEAKDNGDRNSYRQQGPALTFFAMCLKRNRRYLHSYLLHRLRRVRALRLESGPLLPDRVRHDTLSPLESDYFIKYSGALGEYMEATGFDLSQDLQPPKDLLIQVRVLESFGQVMTESGPLALVQGATHFLRRVDVEHLVRQGILEHVRSDEF